jgi:hypothetical protein
MTLRSRRIRLVLGLVAAVVVAAVLVAPVVLTGGPGGKPCAATLLFRGETYTARDAAGGFVQAIAVGIGVTHGCGTTPANVNVRSLAGVAPSRAIGISGDQSSVYVRRGVCARASADLLLHCLEHG